MEKISIKNYFKPTPKNVLRWMGMVKGIIGSSAIITLVDGKPYWSVAILVLGFVIDEISKFIGEEIEAHGNER
jgi:hypothetical protein